MLENLKIIKKSGVLNGTVVLWMPLIAGLWAMTAVATTITLNRRYLAKSATSSKEKNFTITTEYGIVHDDKPVGYAFDDESEVAVVEYLDSDALKSPNVISARRIQEMHCETRKNKFRRISSPGYVRDNKSPPPRKIGQTMYLDTVTVDKHGSSSFIGDNDLDRDWPELPPTAKEPSTSDMTENHQESPRPLPMSKYSLRNISISRQ